MWYFSWILGVGLACSFAILNAMWFEFNSDSNAKAGADEQSAANANAPPQPSTPDSPAEVRDTDR